MNLCRFSVLSSVCIRQQHDCSAKTSAVTAVIFTHFESWLRHRLYGLSPSVDANRSCNWGSGRCLEKVKIASFVLLSN
jgi:hypothetical protein